MGSRRIAALLIRPGCPPSARPSLLGNVQSKMIPIVYLHGFASGPASSKARYFREHLERGGADVRVPDLAAGDFEHLTLTGQLDVIAQTVGGGEVALIGSSMGGYLAGLYAARHPEVRRLVLLAPAFGFTRRWAERLGPQQMDCWRTEGWMDVYHYALQRNCRLGYELMLDAARYEDEPDFRQPALIFHGALDEVVPAAASVAFAARHSNARLEVLDSGHELLNVLDYMVPKVAAFLAEA
jgi:pimeloyl-ACP methyl ester carboxylesterase